MGLAPILPDCSVTWAASSCRKPSAGVVAACSEEGGLSRAGSSSPAEPSDEYPAKTVSGPDPGRPDQFDPTLSGMSRGSPHSLFPSSTQDFLDQRV